MIEARRSGLYNRMDSGGPSISSREGRNFVAWSLVNASRSGDPTYQMARVIYVK